MVEMRLHNTYHIFNNLDSHCFYPFYPVLRTAFENGELTT